jgi:hypothetical protein
VALVAGAGAVGLTSLREFALGALVPALVAGGLAAAVLVPLLLWGAWMATYAMVYGVAWPPELWAGVLGMACLGGLGLSVLVLPPAVPAGVWGPPNA